MNMHNQEKAPSAQEHEGAASPDLILPELRVEKLKTVLVNISSKLNNLVNPNSAVEL